MTAGETPGPAPVEDPPATAVAAVAAVEQARAVLLGGRGRGASEAEVTRHTRARLRLGGRPTTDQRAALAERTARAVGDADAIAAHVAVHADALGEVVGDTVAAIRHRLDPGRIAAGARVDPATLALAVLAAIVATAAVVRRGDRPR